MSPQHGTQFAIATFVPTDAYRFQHISTRMTIRKGRRGFIRTRSVKRLELVEMARARFLSSD